jgi:hypothetical protein
VGSALLDSYIHFKVVKGDDKALIWVFHFLKVFPRADPIYIYIYKAFEGYLLAS